MITPFDQRSVPESGHGRGGGASVLVVVGTRPEVIKMAPVIAALRSAPRFRTRVCAAGQHRELLRQALGVFAIAPDYTCHVNRPHDGLAPLTTALITALDDVVDAVQPDWILAQGDTTTVMAASLVSFYRRVRFGHVEAGLRTSDLSQPFPEELNRRIADLVAAACFAPTPQAREALLREGCDPERIHLTGNTIVDALLEVASRPYEWTDGPLADVRTDRPIVLVTAHRRESFGGPMRQLCRALRTLAAGEVGRHAQFVIPVHLNPEARAPISEFLSDLANVRLVDPLDYVSLIQLLRRAQLVLTDSGGIQEEAPCFGIPVLVLRDKTERPEGLSTGLVRLVGTDQRRIVREAEAVLRMPRRAGVAEPGHSPYGDGRAATRIVSILAGDPLPVHDVVEVSCRS